MPPRAFTPVPNAILDEYLRRLKPSEMTVLLVVIRQTLGWMDPRTKRRKHADWIAGSQLREKTGYSRRSISTALEGLVRKPRTLDLDDIRRLAPLEERIYRLRCVEGWSMVIPWIGFPLDALLRQVEPLGSARFVEFVSYYDQARMSLPFFVVLEFPYVEGLRLDEARHPLTLLTLGLYGEVLPGQNGAPLRLVVPWKYGFKSAKAIVRIRLTREEPLTTWSLAAPSEYGFYANVNPSVDHPRWSQARERRIGELGRRATLPFNGYAEQVAALYQGMDLRRLY